MPFKSCSIVQTPHLPLPLTHTTPFQKMFMELELSYLVSWGALSSNTTFATNWVSWPTIGSWLWKQIAPPTVQHHIKPFKTEAIIIYLHCLQACYIQKTFPHIILLLRTFCESSLRPQGNLPEDLEAQYSVCGPHNKQVAQQAWSNLTTVSFH